MCQSFDIASIVPWSQALLTPIVAILGIWISLLQLDTNKKKLRYDMFEKRYKIYLAAIRFINSVIDNEALSIEAKTWFRRETAAASMLFNEEISIFLQELWHDAITFNCNLALIKDLTLEEERANYEKAIVDYLACLP